jgi:hypothetical protein
MYAEYSGILFLDNEIISSSKFCGYLSELKYLIDENPDFEMAFYQIGISHINRITQNSDSNKLKKIYGTKYKQARYHHLIRAGGDIVKENLNLSKPTLLGGLIYLSKKHLNISP